MLDALRFAVCKSAVFKQGTLKTKFRGSLFGGDMRGQIRTRIVLFTVIAVFFASCTVVRHEDMAHGRGTGDDGLFGFSAREFNFDPEQHAAELWEPVILPRIESMAVDFNHLMTNLASNEDEASRRYGFRFMEGNLFNFAVKGTARILSVDTTSMIGNAAIDFSFDGQTDALMSIGPNFRGTAIRDIQDAISANDFVNQVEFARLARELNNRVRDTVVNDIDFSQHIGEEIEVIAVFSHGRGGGTIEIVPVHVSFNRE